MDEATRKQVLAAAAEQRRRAPAPMFLFGFVWIMLAVVALAGVEMSWAPALAYFSIGVVLLYLGALVSERMRMEQTFRELLEAFETFNRSMYGDNYRVKRAAVDILIQALENDDEGVRQRAQAQLVKITSMDFGVDADAWRAWWAEAKATFTGEAAGASEGA